jgi:1-hydroxy-2-methyl-2-(E)-butenyl 4-diphosphate synthase
VVQKAKERKVPIRIGINAGSLEKRILKKYGTPSAEALVESALNHVRLLEDEDFDLIKISIKASDPLTTIAAYQKISRETAYPLHIGVTEAGPPFSGAIKSSVALGVLLHQGIGDTIRVSLTGEPVLEVMAGYHILRSLHLRERASRSFPARSADGRKRTWRPWCEVEERVPRGRNPFVWPSWAAASTGLEKQGRRTSASRPEKTAEFSFEKERLSEK